MASNPMETAFIGHVEKIVESIFRKHNDADTMFARLNTHLERAQKLDLLKYEGEVHNAIALVYAVYQNNIEAAMQSFLKANDCAIRADDFYLQVKCSNNLGGAYTSELRFDEAFKYYQDVIERGLEQKPLALGVGFSLYSCALKHIVYGQWQQAAETLNQLTGIIDSFEIKTQERNDYGRLIHLLHSASFYVYVSKHNCESARSNLGMALSLAEQLGLPDENRREQLKRFYEFVCHDQEAAYKSQLENDIQMMGTFDALGQISLLYHVGKTQTAQMLVKLLVNKTADPVHSERIKAIFGHRND